MKTNSADKAISYRQFYDMTLSKVRNDANWDESYLEYISYLYGGRERDPIGTHQFDVASEVLYGSSEGIICRVNMYIRTELHGDGHIKRVPLAVFKTLNNSYKAFIKMGQLAAVFSYNAMQVAEEHIHDF